MPPYVGWGVATVLLCLIADCSGFAQLNVDWPSFLGRSDLLWDWYPGSNSAADKWYKASFHGNGAQGMLIRHSMSGSQVSALQFDVSSSAVWDDREPGSPDAKDNNFVCDRPRLPVGYFLLQFHGTIRNVTMRLVLYDAETTGTVITDKGTVTFRAFSHARYDQADVMVIEWNTTGSEQPQWQWTPYPAVSTWAQNCPNYVFNPKPRSVEINGTNVTIQDHLSGTSHSTAFATAVQPLGSTALYIAISNVSKNSQDWSVAAISAARSLGVAALRASHQAWWHAYYPASFVTLRQTRIESFYWINMYKLASGTRADRIVYDLMGPWFILNTPWPDLHWDLNIQLTYWPLFTANRLDLVESLLRLMDDNVDHFVTNVPPAIQSDSAAAPSGASSLECRETCYWDHGTDCLTTPPTVTGNLLWTMQLYYQAYEYSLDTQLLQRMFPLLRRAVMYYTHYQIDNATDHRIHLPPTFSPEYAKAPDCNYDLALYRWALQTIIPLCTDLVPSLCGSDPALPLWKDTLTRLVPYPQGPDGYWIGAGVPLSSSHRHFSHLMMIFPLRTIDFSNQQDTRVAEVSVDHWLGMSNELTGFCRTAASSMNVLLGRREAAYSNITYLLDGYILPNTFYHEGEDGECGETPPAASSAIQDWAVMARNGVIEVFAGIDDKQIADYAFWNLRAQGAFLVSGSRSNGETQFIQIQSLKGARCTINVDIMSPISTYPAGVSLTPQPDGSLLVDLKTGDTVVLYHGSSLPNLTISASPGYPAQFNAWGVAPTPPVQNRIYLDRCVGSPQQTWNWDGTPSTKAQISLRSDATQCMAVTDCIGHDGSPINLVQCTAAPCKDATLWYSDTQNALMTALSGRCIDVNGGGLSGRLIDLWDCNDNAQYHNTQWVYNKTDGSIRSLDPLVDPYLCLTHA